ncbi:MAG: VWA domain-containing protein [Fimbriiglobus sp.]
MIAAATPNTPDYRTPIEPEGVALAIVVDVSGSMGAEDFPTETMRKSSRLRAAQTVFKALIQGGEAEGKEFPGRPRDAVAIVAFAAVPRTVCPLTLNHSVAMQTLDTLQPKVGVDAGTNLGDAIAEAVIRLDASKVSRRVIVVLSDGEHNSTGMGESRPLQPLEAAQLAKSLNMAIHTIDCGGPRLPSATLEERQQRADGQATLQNIAQLTSGQHFMASSMTELAEVSANLDKLERQPQIVYRYRKSHNHATKCAMIGLSFLLLARFLTLGPWRTWPG